MATQAPDRTQDVSERARAIYRDALVWDMTVPYGMQHATDGETLPRFRKAGVGVVSLTIGGDKTFGPAPALSNIARVYEVVARHPGDYRLVRAIGDVEAARAAGQLAITLNFQGTNALGNDLGMIEVFYRLGVRHMLMAYNQKNLVGDGCAERTDCGLSRFGLSVVREMNRVGMLVDGTHTGYRTSMEAMEASTSPCIFSHCNAYAVFPHYRNIRDDQIRKCAQTGGVIGVNGLGEFLDDMEARSESMFRHLDHIVGLVGAQHAGIGLDYVKDVAGFWKYVDENPDAWPDNDGKPNRHTAFVQPEQLPDLAELMLRKNYAEEDVRGILGGNFHRVCRQVWK
ncbi:MAG TPA: membrane dipeptidase [Usitatibacter sp.]|nr:membrane dipeptidase [Usitatibacter sp.]